MKSAILSLLGLNIKTDVHFEGERNSSDLLLTNYLLKAHCSSCCSLLARTHITSDLDHGFRNLIEGHFAKKDIHVIKLDQTTEGEQLFSVSLKVPCFPNELYFDLLADEIHQHERDLVLNGLFLEVTFDAFIDLDAEKGYIKTQPLIMRNYDGYQRCLLDDVLSYCYEQYNNPLALRAKLDRTIDILEIVNLEYFQMAANLKNLSFA